MVGTINKALEDTIYNEYGEEILDAIKRQAKVTETTFISMDAYFDDILYRRRSCLEDSAYRAGIAKTLSGDKTPR
jgi:uncharacterized protein YbgA (DUF1722 family)